MQRSSRQSFFRLVLGLFVTLCVGGWASPVHALTKSELACQRTIANASRSYARDILGARQDCVLRVLKGKAAPMTDCLAGTGDGPASADLGKAAALLAQRIPSRCGGVDLTQLDFPGSCQDQTGPPFSVLDLEDCIISMMTANAADLLQFEYPMTIDRTASRQERRCIDKVGRRGKRLVVREMRARQNCLDREQQFMFGETLNCRDPLPPEAAGTGDDRFDRPILRARVRLLTGIPENCRTVDINGLGYGDDCPDFTGAPFSIVDMQTCQRDAHVSSVRTLLELSYPSPPACGNGIREDVEECDDGNANQNDGCLNDCTLASCGDGLVCSGPSCTTGPGGGPEVCDDGNTSNTDGCLDSCQPSACGDGFVCSAFSCTTGPGGGPEQCDDANTNNNDACVDTCATSRCGDGFVEFGKEDCDDANTSNNDSCMNSCVFAACGDGVTCTAADCLSGPNGGPEQCDDGNTVDTDFCKSDCSLFVCGDGLLFPGAEECDDGNTVNGDGCASDCTIEGFCGDGQAGIGEDCDGSDDAACPGVCRSDCLCPGCGNGVLDSGEACDDGNQINTDGCSNTCTLPACGDGIVNGSDQCDDANSNDNDSCRNDCTTAVCGDGVLCTDVSCSSGPGGGVEVCDDGNTTTGDGCDSTCGRETVCGDGFLDGSEACDPGGIGGAGASDSACPGVCRTDCLCPACGDGVVDTGEACDDGNTIETDGCHNDCSLAACGDGLVCSDAATCNTGPGAGVEECDDGNAADTDACRDDCSLAACGDGVVCADVATCTTGPGGGVEECDDGNVIPGDGCDASCMTELIAGAGCPATGQLELFSGVGKPCLTNADCRPAGVATCDTGIGKCRTGSELDTGWTGVSHNGDTIENVFLSGSLTCPGQGGACGTCSVDGVDPSARSCRCANDVTTVCDKPFQADNTNCGGAQCECFLGPPLALGVPGAVVCVVNKFDQDISGTADVDTGDAEITANLRSLVHTGTSLFAPCPVCGGTCVAPTQSRCTKPFSSKGNICTTNSDCDSSAGAADGVCKATLGSSCFRDEDCDVNPGDGLGSCLNFDTTPRDGIREGTCFGGQRDGLACDVDAVNTTFPALPGSNGGAASYDCPPLSGANISGAGLQIGLVTTTGRTEMTRSIDCGSPISFPPFVQVDCFCRVCSGSAPGALIPCNSDAECAAVGAGTCSVNGNSAAASPGFNQCSSAPADGGDGFSTGSCVAIDAGGIEGECQSATDDITFCDGVVRADGTALQPCDPRPLCLDTLTGCTTNADCNAGVTCSPDAGCSAAVVGLDLGTCSLVERKPCFLDPIIAQGNADPNAPMGAANFCVPPTVNSGINSVGGLPGPGRVRIQTQSTLFCASDPNVVYTPGVGGCP